MKKKLLKLFPLYWVGWIGRNDNALSETMARDYYEWVNTFENRNMKTKEKPSPSPIIEQAFKNIKTKKQMKKEEIIETLSLNKDVLNHILERLLIVEEMLEEKGKEGIDLKKVEKKIDEMLEHTVIEPQHRKLIMSVEELISNDAFEDWSNDNLKILSTFDKLKFIEQQWNDGKEFDWENEEDKYNLYLYENKLTFGRFCATSKIFNFHTEQHAKLFLETFAKELEVIKPLFS